MVNYCSLELFTLLTSSTCAILSPLYNPVPSISPFCRIHFMNSIIGIVAILFVAWLLSTNRKKYKAENSGVCVCFTGAVCIVGFICTSRTRCAEFSKQRSVEFDQLRSRRHRVFYSVIWRQGASPLRSMYWVSSFSSPLLSPVFITLV